MADHGWQLGEHDSWHKQTNFVNLKCLTPTLAPSTVADERVAFSQELGARVPLLIKVPWLRATSGGKTTPVLAELIDIFPTLAALTGTAAALSEEHLDGESLADLFTDPARAPADDDAAYSQYIRCHNMSQPAYDNDNLCVPDNKTQGVETIMGYGPLHNRSVAHPFLLAALHSKFIGEQ